MMVVSLHPLLFLFSLLTAVALVVTDDASSDRSRSGTTHHGFFTSIRRDLLDRNEDKEVKVDKRDDTTTTASAGVRPRVIGGQDVKDELRYPYFGLMWESVMCAGALIAPDLVISAAHCLNISNTIRIGRHDRFGNDMSQEIEIIKQISYPMYLANNFQYDILILQLANATYNHPYIHLYDNNNNNNTNNNNTNLMKSSSTTTTTRVSPDNMTDDNNLPYTNLTVLGFGNARQGQSFVYPTYLQEAVLNYIPNDECDDFHLTQGNPVTNDMLCAAAPGRDACVGDSGGPLVAKGNSPEEDRLVGIVSWGQGCADERYPGVYARISYFYDWIIETSCHISQHPPDYFDCISMGGGSNHGNGHGTDTTIPTENLPPYTTMGGDSLNNSTPVSSPSSSSGRRKQVTTAFWGIISVSWGLLSFSWQVLD